MADDDLPRDDQTSLIVATVHDYFDGWFDGDAERMERALHGELVKRTSGPDHASTLGVITAVQMVAATREGVGQGVAAGLSDRSIDVAVLDVDVDIATVVVRSEPYHEYLHLVRTRDGWKIANALWRDKP